MSQYNRKMGGGQSLYTGGMEGERGRSKGRGEGGRGEGKEEGKWEEEGERGKEEDKLTNVYQRSFPFPRIL